MKKSTISMAMAAPCPYLQVKRHMSRRPKSQFSPYPWLFLLLFSSKLTYAQQFLQGKVTDNQGQPLFGATVTESQSKTAVQTDAEGNFKLPVKQNSGILQVSFLGYQSRQINYQLGQSLNIQLQEDPSTLRAVEINTGYYSVQQKLLTGSISTLSAKEIEKQPVSNPLQALQGRLSGAQVSQSSGIPGAPISILIRGTSSLDAGSQPLYLVDGVPFGSQSLSSTQTTSNYGGTGASPFASLAQEDIESISILKDADATAIYGSRGANGVVLITTKKGKQGQLQFNLNTYLGISQLAKTLDLLSTPDYLDMRRAAFQLDNTSIKPADYDLNGNWDQNRQTDWQQQLLGNKASFHNQRISLSGGNSTSNFLLAATRQQQGTITSAGDQYTKYSVQLSAGQSSNDQKINVNLSANYSADDNDWTNADLLNRALTLSPNAPALYQPDGSLNWASSTWTNPLRAFENPFISKSSTLISNLSASYEPLKHLKASISAGYTSSRQDDMNYTPVSYYDPAQNITPASSALFTNAASSASLIAEPQLSYQLRHPRYGKLQVLLGYSIQQLQRQQLATLGAGFASDALIQNIQAATTVQVRANTATTYRYSGLYARIGYQLQDRYLLNLTARRDGSSRFGPDRRSATFGAIGAAYLASETQWVKQHLPFVSLLKLRTSLGTSGNDQIGDYEYLNTYQSQTGYNGAPGLSPLRLYNPDFGWEKSLKAELGLELGLWSDRLQLTVNYYRNRSSSQLVNYPLPGTTGFASIRSNLAATVQNTGLELELYYRHKAGKLHWESSLNYTIPRNKLIEFPGLAQSSYASRYEIGQPLSIGKVYQLQGVDPTTGLYTFSDLNGDGLISAADRLLVVQRGQRGYGGWNNTLSYGHFDLSFLAQVVFQRSTTFRAGLSTAPGRMSNLPLADKDKYWKAPGDIAEFQRLTSGANSAAVTAYANYLLSDAATGDASFLRLKSLSLGYRNTKLVPGKTLRLYFQGQNLLTLSDYFGLDPEQPGLTTPPLRTLTLGLQLTL